MQHPWENGRLERCPKDDARDSGEIRVLRNILCRCSMTLIKPPQAVPRSSVFDREIWGSWPPKTEAAGIEFEAREVESTKPPEPRWKIWRVTCHQLSCTVPIAMAKTAAQRV